MDYNFLFGNIDEDGNPDSDLDQELREGFEKLNEAGMSHLLNMGNILKDSELEENNINSNKQLYHDTEVSSSKQSILIKRAHQANDYDYELDHPLDQQSAEDSGEEYDKLVKRVKANGNLKFTELLMINKKPSPTLSLKKSWDNYQNDPRIHFFSPEWVSPLKKPTHFQTLLSMCTKRETGKDKGKDESKSNTVDTFELDGLVPKHFYPFLTDSWEDKIIYEGSKVNNNMDKSPKSILEKVLKFKNQSLETETWEDNINWEGVNKDYIDNKKNIHVPLIFDLNDVQLLFEPIIEDVTKSAYYTVDKDYKGSKLLKRARKLEMKGITKYDEADMIRAQNPTLDPFNLSNDLYYEVIKDTKVAKIRQTFGQLYVHHSSPAVKLLPPFFKTRLTKSELRNFHRPALHFPISSRVFSNAETGVLTTSKISSFNFSKIKKSQKKKPLKHMKQPHQLLKSPKDLTLKDGSSYILLEYSEEHPPIIHNVGMGSKLINYYRKKFPEDDHLVKGDIGEKFVLEINDVSPFMNFGDVDGGETILSLFTNLVRAPLFLHKPNHNDFLVIKTMNKGSPRFYIRELPDILLCGQTYPVQDVPAPHSRKVTQIIRNRLQVAAYRSIKKNADSRLKISRLAKMFPEYSEGQIRQRLKEFADFKRGGNNAGYWQLKNDNSIPSEEEIRNLLTPEMICLYESMLVGQRHLQDAGYSKLVGNGDEDETQFDIEEQLAPWIITRNFVDSSQGKAMLKLHGDGDPTGRGEGFSFARVSMKELFLRPGENLDEKIKQRYDPKQRINHRYNVADQQKVYKEEIKRIWDLQKKSLSNPIPVELGEKDSTDSQADKTQEVNYGSKILTIKRMIRDYNGNEKCSIETVTHPGIIKAYLKQRQTIEENDFDVESLQPTNDEERNKFIRKKIEMQLMRLKSIRDRRNKRTNNKDAINSNQSPIINLENVGGGDKQSGLVKKSKSESSRRCGACGNLGHMKTNKRCPLYKESTDEPPILNTTDEIKSIPKISIKMKNLSPVLSPTELSFEEDE